MALEGEAELGPVGAGRLVARSRLLLGSLLAEVLDAHSPLDGAYGEPLLVWEDRHAPDDRARKKARKNKQHFFV